MTDIEFTSSDFWAGRPVARQVAEAMHRGRIIASGKVVSQDIIRIGRTPSTVCRFDDGTGEIDLLFVGQPEVARLYPGTSCTVEGTARIRNGRMEIWNPIYEVNTFDPNQKSHIEELNGTD